MPGAVEDQQAGLSQCWEVAFALGGSYPGCHWALLVHRTKEGARRPTSACDVNLGPAVVVDNVPLAVVTVHIALACWVKECGVG